MVQPLAFSYQDGEIMNDTPERYTVLPRKPEELAETIKQANELGLKWYARCDYGAGDEVYVYLFFDEVGLQAFLSKQWGSYIDDVTELLKGYQAHQMSAKDFAEQVGALLGMVGEYADHPMDEEWGRNYIARERQRVVNQAGFVGAHLIKYLDSLQSGGAA